MPKKNSAPKKPTKSFEETLWDTTNKLRGSVESLDWNVLTKTTRQGCPEGEHAGANQNASPLLHSPFLLHTYLTKSEGEIRQKLVENDLVVHSPLAAWDYLRTTLKLTCPSCSKL
ncbi:MAG: hypothetical protein AAF065_01750 [Verrucomicrobiota bacterium]